MERKADDQAAQATKQSSVGESHSPISCSSEVASMFGSQRSRLHVHQNQVEVVEFVEQSIFQSTECARSAIHISGATGENSVNINGIWIPTVTSASDNLVYIKEGDNSKCIEHSDKSWKLKPSKGPECWAFLEVCAPLESCSTNQFEWKVSAKGAKLVPQKYDDASDWSAQTCITIQTVRTGALSGCEVVIFGATGPHASKINGIWARSQEISGGYHVYTKHGDTGLCIEHLTPIGQWQIKPVSQKGKNQSWASVEGHCPLENCFPVVWRVSESSCFQSKVDQPSVKILIGSDPKIQAALCRPSSKMIHASGFALAQFNGVFLRDPTTLSYHHSTSTSLRIELQPQLRALGASTVERIVGKCFDGPAAFGHIQVPLPDADAFAQGDVFYGAFKLNNGTYEGQWANGKMNGHGVMQWHGGASYIGSWVDGQWSGHGMYRWADGSVFEGLFLNGCKHGHGSITFAVDGNNRAPELVASASQSVQQEWYSWKAGDSALITYKADKRHGPCTYTFFNGETFECEWVDGVCPEFSARQLQVLAAPDQASAAARAAADAKDAEAKSAAVKSSLVEAKDTASNIEAETNADITAATCAPAPSTMQQKTESDSPVTLNSCVPIASSATTSLFSVSSPASTSSAAPSFATFVAGASELASLSPTGTDQLACASGPVVSVLASPNSKHSTGRRIVGKRQSGSQSPPPAVGSPAASPIASTNAVLLENPVQVPSDCGSEDPPFSGAWRRCRNTQAKIQEIPDIIRVSRESILVSEHLQVVIKGMTGPHASKINGTYISTAGIKERWQCDPLDSSSDACGAQRSKSCLSAPGSLIHIIGATGPRANSINGFFEAVDEMSCDHRVYIKCNNPGICIHFWQGIWSLTQTENKGKNGKANAILRFADPLEAANPSLHFWEVAVENSTWSVQTNVRCSFGTDVPFKGLKKIDGDTWLQRCAGKFSVCDERDRYSDKGYIFCDVYQDELQGGYEDFQLLCTPWFTEQPWYSIKQHAAPGNSLDNGIVVFHPEVSVICNPSLPFTGIYRSTYTPGCRMPAFIHSGPDSYVIEYCDKNEVWFIRQRSSNQVLATSCAVSPGFPVPTLWAASQNTPGLLSCSVSSMPSVDHACFSYPSYPPSLLIAAANAGTDAALFEGSYDLVDCILSRCNRTVKVLYTNATSGLQLRLVISTYIEFAGISVDGAVLFERRVSLSKAEEFVLLTSLFTNVPSFCIDLFRTPCAPGALPAFKVLLTEQNTQSQRCSSNTAFQTHMMPMLSHPSCVSAVKKMIKQANFDARSFWKNVLHQMCGQSEVADSHSLHRTLEFSRLLLDDQSQADAFTTLLPSMSELLCSPAFQRYVQFDLVAAVAREVTDFVLFFLYTTGNSVLGGKISKNQVRKDIVLHFGSLLQNLSSKLVSEYLQSVSKTNFELVCFIARSTAERCQALLPVGKVSAREVLSPVCIAMAHVFDLNEETCLRLRTCVMQSRSLALHNCSQLTLVSESMLLLLTPIASICSIDCDVRFIVTIVTALIVATVADRQSLVRDSLLFELQQAIYAHDNSIQLAFCMEQQLTSLIWSIVSADPSFPHLTVQQIVQVCVLIHEDMTSCFQRHKMDVSRCTDHLSMALACVILSISLNSSDGTSEFLSGNYADEIFQKHPSFSKCISLCVSNFMRSKYLECVPVALSRAGTPYVRCSAPSSASIKGSGAKMIITQSSDESASECLDSQNVERRFPELLWLAIVEHQPMLADDITSDLVQHRGVAELRSDMANTSSLEISVEDSLRRLQQRTDYDFLVQGATGYLGTIINGIYSPTSELSGERTVYAKKSDDSTRIHFWVGQEGSTSKWLIASKANQGKNDTAYAYFKHNGPLEDIVSKSGWHVQGGMPQLSICMRRIVAVPVSRPHVADVDAQTASCSASPSQRVPEVGADCHVCQRSCEAFFYWAPERCSYICLRCIIDECVPKSLLRNLRLSSIFSQSFTRPIFQKVCLHSLSAVFHCSALKGEGMGRLAAIWAVDPEYDPLPKVESLAIPAVGKFSAKSDALQFSNSNKTVLRPSSNGCFPIATAIPLANECTFEVVIDSEPVSNTLSFGVALKSIRLHDTNGVGATHESWGVMCQFGNSTVVTKMISSGTEQGKFRALCKGDRLKGVANFEERRFEFFLNDSEITHTFTIGLEADNLKHTDYVFAMSLATEAQVTVLNRVHTIPIPTDSITRSSTASLDDAFMWIQSATQEVVHIMRPSHCDGSSVVDWFHQAMSAVSNLLGIKSDSVTAMISNPAAPAIGSTVAVERATAETATSTSNVESTLDDTSKVGAIITMPVDGHGEFEFTDGSKYVGYWKDQKPHGKGVFFYAADRAASPPDRGYGWNAGDSYEGEFNLGMRHGAGKYTFFNGQSLDCSWSYDRCHKFMLRQRAVLAAVAQSKLDLQIGHFLCFSVVRNALLLTASELSSRDTFDRQLIPSVLSMCADSGRDNVCATLRHFLICDVLAATLPIADIRKSISESICQFLQGNTSRTLKLYVGLQTSFLYLWECLLKVSPNELPPKILDCMAMYADHTEFIQSVIRAELLECLSEASVEQFMDALVTTGKCGKIAEAILPTLFTTQTQIRWQMALWLTRVIPPEKPPSFGKDFHAFIATLCGLAVSESALGFICTGKEIGMSFLLELHVAYFQSNSQEPFSIQSWASASKHIDNILKNTDVSFSGALLDTMAEMRGNAIVYVLRKIPVDCHHHLFETIMEALLALADDLVQTPAKNWSQNEALMHRADLLCPWTSCISGLSFNHAVVMSSIVKHIGAFSTKGHILSRFLKILSAIDVVLVQVWDVKDDAQNASNATDLSINFKTRHRLTHLLVAARSCFQRLSISMLHENLSLAIDVTLELCNNSHSLTILGSLLIYIRSTLLPPHNHPLVRSATSASLAVKCSLCGASCIDCMFADPASTDLSESIECQDCHQRRSGQRLPMRVCDILGEYALQMLRGEVDARADQCKSLMHVFEMVYPIGQFALSKAAVVCISSLLVRWLDRAPHRSRIHTIKIPRWAAHALFPEYGCAIALRCGEAFAGPCAAALGWWIDSRGVRHSVHDHILNRFPQHSSFAKHEDRLPFGLAFSSACISILSMMRANGTVSEARAVAALLQQGMPVENIGACIMHLINSSVVVASSGRFWTSSPHGRTFPSEEQDDEYVEIPGDSESYVFVQFDDETVAPLPQSSSVHTAIAVPQSKAEQALVDGVQFVLEHAPAVCSDLLRLASALRVNHGSFSRSLSALMFERGQPTGELSAEAHDDASVCPVCQEEPVGERNSCGHGLCATCWTNFVASTIHNSSTPEVQKGNDDDGGSVVLDIKCPGDATAKCRCPVQFSVLRKALPQGIETLVRTVMRSMSRQFLSGAAAIAQCVCGAVVCGTLLAGEVECTCGHVQCIGDMKRGFPRASYIPHPNVTSDEEQVWRQMNTVGSEQRSMIMRYKNCPKCGTMTTKCGCQGVVVCAGMDKCPKEACDHMKCSKCNTDWCWTCRRIGSTEQRCSRPLSEQKDTKELLLRFGPEVQQLETTLKEMAPASLFEILQLQDSEAGVISLKLNRSVLSISGVPVNSVQTCQRALSILHTQAIVIETADLQATEFPSGWTEMVLDGQVLYYNSQTLVIQRQRPLPAAVPPKQRKIEVMHAPGYFSGSVLFSNVCAADNLVRERSSKILSVGDAVSRDSAFENVQDTQGAFDALFVNICNACSAAPMDQLIGITRHITGSQSRDVISALSASPLSTAAAKSLMRYVHQARTALKFD